MTQSLDQFGASGNGRTDDTAAFQRAVDWSAQQGGATVRAVPGAVYRLTDRVRSIGALGLELGDAEIFLDAEPAGLHASARLEGPFDLTEAYEGGLHLPVALPPEAPLPAPGSWIKVISDALEPYQRDRGADDRVYPIAEWAEIGEGSTRSRLALARPLRQRRGIDPRSAPGDEPAVWPWAARFSPRMVWAHADPVTITGGIWAHPPERDGWHEPTIVIAGHIGPRLERVHVARGYDTAIRLTGTQGAQVLDCRTENLANDPSQGRFGYGVAEGGARSTLVHGLRGRDTRHLFTTSIGPARRGERRPAFLIGLGTSEGALVRDGSAGPHELAPWDTHHDARYVTFERIAASGGKSPAVAIRGRQIAVRGLTLDGTGRGLSVFADYSSGQVEDDLWLNGTTRADYPMAQISDYSGSCRTAPVAVRAAALSLAGTGRIAAQGHCGLRINSGAVTVTGAHHLILGPGATAEEEDALILLSPGHEKTRRVFGGATLDVAGLLEVDGTGVRRPGLHGLRLGPETRMRVSGLLVLRLPAAAGVLRTGEGALTFIGDGAMAVTRPERDGATLHDAGGTTEITERALGRRIAALAPRP
ncbi:hypothetical protein [Jannaschia formosa]|uniref:hypothetical protein n=1 Tax=Jannaschia formosa TaxID=2259592 RepID=UPI000E1C341C|nr:hypothetical protein [Jannaschia formosa]TFL20248.1 hypothetical protein DR046_02595 [Jannaschia formosa]